jgi:hypothetical protein
MQGFQALPEIVHCFRNWSSICARMTLSKEFLHVSHRFHHLLIFYMANAKEKLALFTLSLKQLAELTRRHSIKSKLKLKREIKFCWGKIIFVCKFGTCYLKFFLF